MTVKLEPRHLLREGQAYVTWFVRMPAGTSYADILRPSFWAAVYESISANDLLRCQAADLSFDAMFVVVARATGGLRLHEFPVRPAATETKEPT